MQRFSTIVFGTDFSACAAHAQAYAFALARRFEAVLHVVHIIDTNYPSYAGVYGFGAEVDVHIDEVKKHAQENLAQIVELAREQGIEAHPKLLGGPTAEELVDIAATQANPLLVIGTHGRSGFDHFLFGSTCERIVRLSPVPVLSVKSQEREFVEDSGEIVLKRVLCPCDLSPVSENAVRIAAELCRAFDAELLLVHVVDDRIQYPSLMPGAQFPTDSELHVHAAKGLDRIAARCEGVRTHTEVIQGSPHRAIVETAVAREADLIVMTTHGRTGFAHVILGSTTEKVVRTAPTPILTTRPTETVTSGEHAAGHVPGDIQPATV